MIKKLNELAKKHEMNTNIDGRKLFDDDIARKTQWTPLKRGGSNFKTHNLVQKSAMSLQYKLSKGGKFFIGIFTFIGLILFMIGIMLLIASGGSATALIFFFIGLVFTVLSVFMMFFMGKACTFDRSLGIIYKGSKAPKLTGPENKSIEMVNFKDVYALQILKEFVRSDKSRYFSYEINLITYSGSRFNLVDHGNYPQIQADAEQLVKFLGCKLWDTVNPNSSNSARTQ